MRVKRKAFIARFCKTNRSITVKSRIKRKAVFSLLTATCLCGPAMAKLPPGISGPWYNPDQSGHGLSVDLVAPDRAVVFWYAYDNEGNPMTLYIEGAVNGREITGTAYAPRGMRFGEFNPADLQLPRWGRVTLNFDDCSSGTLSWDASSADFADGSIAIEKLASLDGLDCALPPVNDLPVTLVNGVSPGDGTYRPEFAVHGILDREGRLWAIERGLSIPGPTWVGAHAPNVAIVVPESLSGDGSIRAVGATYNDFWASNQQAYRARYEGIWRRGAGGHLTLTPDLETHPDRIQNFNRYTATAPAGYQLVAPVHISDLARGFRVDTRGQFFALAGSLAVEESGSACLRLNTAFAGNEDGPCDFTGKITAGEGDLGLLDVELVNQNDLTIPPYRGRGWLMDGPDGRELILIGHNGNAGLGLIGNQR